MPGAGFSIVNSGIGGEALMAVCAATAPAAKQRNTVHCRRYRNSSATADLAQRPDI
jgi:hypothetical protein